MVRNKDIVKWSSSIVVFLIFIGQSTANKEGYYGKYIGKLSQLHHGVSGDVFAVDARTLHIRNFNYDGEGPAAYFYAGNSKAPGVNGFRLRDERGTTNVLPRYRNKHITITLPEGKTLQNIRWFSVWCDEFSVNFGDVKISKNLDFPKPQKISGLSGVHGVSSEPIVIVDAQTLLIPSFSYDGEAPDAKFWVGRGFKPSPQGIRIPDENGKELPLRRYDRKTIVLTLPGDLTIFDIGHFGVWCEAFTVDFGHVQIPRGLNIPPSLKMLGVSPQSKLNCEVLWDDFAYEVRWAVAGDSIVLQLVARLENNEYMSFGLSGDKTKSRMVGGDVVVAWVDKDSLKGYAKDYYLDAKSQCSGGRGSCPDENIAAGTESVRLLNAALVNGYSIVTFQRSLKPSDELDKPVYTNQSQPIIWAIGPLNSRKEVSYHSLANRGDIFIDFGRSPKWNCPTPESTSEESEADAINREYEEARVQDTRVQDSTRRESRPKTQIPTPAPAPKSGAWEIPSIKCYEPEDGVFYAQMGPTGGKHGYSAITGHVGWGISWYINGLLIPEINVVRGRTYTFIVEGGLDPETPARYHPFYITDDPVGGYQYKTPQERANIQIFAGAVQNKRGEVRPTGVGRLCNWTPDPNAPPADEFTSFGAYQRTLRLECDPGNPGIIQWTVEKDTPDTVYYQCYTHRYLGWKINVHDHCEGEAAASDPVPSVVKAPESVIKSHEADSEVSESISYETRVKPDAEFLNVYFKNQSNGPNEFINREPVKYFPGLNEQDIKAIQQIPIQQLQVQYPQAAVIIQQQPVAPAHQQTVIPQSVSENKLIKFAPPHSQRISGYSVREEPENVQSFQNFQIVPAQQFQEEVVRITETKPENKFLNYQILRTQEEKLKRNKPQFGKPGRVPVPVPAPNRLRKPVPFHALTLQQRPFPPGAFRPPTLAHKPQKRIPPQKYRPAPEETRQEHRPVRKPPQPSHDLFPSSTINKESLNIPFAHNNGFDPQSVQVEGGFKPILNTGIAPKIIERADVVLEDESDGKVGVIDLSTEETIDKDNLFKNQKPQSFEPIFIPSYPDDSVKKYQEKYKKKPYLSLKPRYDESKNGQVYVKIRPNTNLIRRPLYPDVVPFRIQGGMPSLRSQEAEEDQTEATTFKAENILDVIEMYEANATDAKEQKKDVQDEIAMADDRKDYYLPPKPKFLSYDGKVVKVDAPDLPDAPTPDVHKLPQFVPFKGAIPPLTQTVNAQNLPQLRTSKLARDDILPPSERKKRSPDHIPGHVGPHDHDHDHDHVHDHDHDHNHLHSGSTSRNSNLLLMGILLLCLQAASF